MDDALFCLPDETRLTPLLQSFPGREHQIRTLATLMDPDAAPCWNLVVHGTETTGKSAITEQLLARLAGGGSGRRRLGYTVVKAAQCVTGRHLLERVVGAVAAAVEPDAGRPGPGPGRRRCETLAQLAVALGALLGGPSSRDPRWRFVLVLDAVDGQRDAPPTLVPALARLSERMPCLGCVFIVTAPPAGLLRTPASPHVHFPPYTKAEFVRILSLTPPTPLPGATQPETAALWTRFCAAVHDGFVRSASRTLPTFRHACRALWPRFTGPVAAGTLSARDFSKLLVAARAHFHDESLLNPGVVSEPPPKPPLVPPSTDGARVHGPGRPRPPAAAPVTAELVGLLPMAARLLLLSAYLASHNTARHDLTLFSTYHHHGRRHRLRGAGFAAPRAKHRKIARKLLGARAFILERMLAIFEAVRAEWLPPGSSVGAAGLDGDVAMALATLASLRLLVRVGSGDVIDRAGKWRVNVGWDVIRGIGRSIGVEVEEWLTE